MVAISLARAMALDAATRARSVLAHAASMKCGCGDTRAIDDASTQIDARAVERRCRRER